MQKKFFRIVALLLSILIAANSQFVFAFAVGESKMTISVESIAANPGDSVQVKINIANNPGIASLKFDVKYDEYLTLTNVEFNSEFGSYVTAPTPYKNPQTISMISPLKEIGTNGNFATLTFSVSNNMPARHHADITVTYDEDDIFDADYNNVPVEVVNGYVETGASVENQFTVQVGQAVVDEKTVKVDVILSNNPGLASLKFNVAYDEYLTLTNVEFNSAFGSYVTAPMPYKNPQTISMISPLSEVNVNGVFATLTFSVKDEVSDNYLADITISFDKDDIFGENYENIATKVINGSVFLGNTIMPRKNTNTIINRNTKLIYGLETDIKDINDFVDCSKVETSIVSAEQGFGTGTTINIIRNGAVVETYSVIVFGDVNGDSLCDGADAVIMHCLASGMLTKDDVSEAIWTAADCNHDGVINDDDAELLKNVGVFIGKITQTA